MIKKLEKLYHRYDEQKKVYAKYGSKLSNDEKYSLIYEYLNNSRDFWGYIQLLCDITLEIVDDSDKFIELLSNFDQKIRGDMYQKPFTDLLVKIGSKDFASSLYNKILNNQKLDDNLRIISGLILGGMNSEKEIKARLKQKIKYPFTNSYLKAILVYYENQNLGKEIYDYFNKILKTQNFNIIRELAFISFRLYDKNSKYFYKIIKQMTQLNDLTINWIIYNRLSYDNKFTKEQFFELVNIAKDYDIKIIDEIIQAFREYSKEHKKIVGLFIHWLNKFDKFEFDSRNFKWVLEDLVKKNKLFIKDFFENYKKIQPDRKGYLFIFPYISVILSKFHKDYILQQILRLKIINKNDRYIFYELCQKLIGNIYNDVKYKEIILELNNKLVELVKKRPFISFKEKKYFNKVNKIKNLEIDKNNYDYLINIANSLLNKLRNRKKEYDFKLIRKNISKYPSVYNLSKKLLINLELNKQFSPLLWLGETEEPKIDNVKISEKENELNKALKISFIKSKFWSRAYLKELDLSLSKYINLPNEKYNDAKNRILKDFADNNSFWSFESELVFMDKFSKNIIFILEPKVPNRPEKNLDLKINLFNKDIYFEVQRPEMDRSLNLDNGAVSMPNKALRSIDKKFRQMMAKKTIEEMKSKKRKDLFFIVIDTSGSTIDDYQIANAFYGSLSLTLVRNKKDRHVINQFPSRKDDSIHKINQNTDIVSGVIYFKQELMFDNKNQPFVKLKGDIIQNPKGINTLTDKELIELKKIIFD